MLILAMMVWESVFVNHLIAMLARFLACIILAEHKLFVLLETINFWSSKQLHTVFQTTVESFWVIFSLIYAADCSHASFPI